MGGKRQIAVVIATTILLAIAAVGCGGAGSSASAGSTTSAGTSSGSGGDSKIQYPGKRPSGSEAVHFGREASVAEREEASRVVEEDLKARAAGDWAKQCAVLSTEQSAEVREFTYVNGKEDSCTDALRTLASPLPQTKSLRADNMASPVYAFRIGANRGFAFYHGKEGTAYTMAMKHEDGRWKVDDLTPTELPKL
jgi:hypothetical protein